MFNHFFIFTFILLLPNLLLLIRAEMEEMDKRQVGVLARDNSLPKGKRSVEALARNGELPGKREEDRINQLRLYRFLNEVDAALKHQILEHEFGKRNMEAMARAGYLVKPATKLPEVRPGLTPEQQELLGKVDNEMLAENEDGFNAADEKRGGLGSLARHGYLGKRNEELEENSEDKRSVGAAKNFLSLGEKRNIGSLKSFMSRTGKRNIASLRNFMSGKRNLGSARNFAASKRDYYDDEVENDNEYDVEDKRNVGSARRFTGKRNIGAARNFLFHEMKKNLGAARQFFAGNKKNLGAARNSYYGKRNIASLARDGGFHNFKYGRDETDPWEVDDEFDFDDFHDDEKRNLESFLRSQSGKRYLGSLRAGKRNLAAFKSFGKRLIDADRITSTSYLTDPTHEDINEFLGKEDDLTVEKRETKDEKSLGLSRRKRSPEFAFSPNEPMSDVEDYNDYEDELYTNSYAKRFLGSEPRTFDGMEVNKRHIGALARLGLLPSFRSTRYSRSGRATDNTIFDSREDPPIRACFSKDSASPRPKTSSVETKLAVRRAPRMPFGPYSFWTASTPVERSIWTPVPYHSSHHTKHPMYFSRAG